MVRPDGRDAGILGGVGSESGERVAIGGFERGEVFVGAELMTCFIRSGTDEGMTLSTMVNAGRRRTVVESSTVGSVGRGIFEADSMSFWYLVSYDFRQAR